MLKRIMLARIDAYRERTSPHCATCQETPERSFSYQVRQKTEASLMAGLTMLALGYVVSYLPLSAGPRDKWGWRKGGI